MAKFTKEMLEMFKTNGPVAFATASKKGVPNVALIGVVWPNDDGTISFIDNFMNKTCTNLLENPQAAFYLWNKDCKESYQVKGTIAICGEGPEYEAAVAKAHAINEGFPAKHLLKFTPTDIYYMTPGPNAGKKVQ